MRVLVIGGYGLIGGYVVSELLSKGHDVVGAGRRISDAQRRFPRVRWVVADLASLPSEAWDPLLTGVDAIVNCAGALQDSPSDNLRAVHVTGLVALADAAKRVGVGRLIHISAAGMAEGSDAFGRTKVEAEQALRSRDIDWTVLRPGLVLAPAAFGGSALLRGLAAFPLAIPAVYPDSLIQVVDARDLAHAVAAALEPAAPRRVTVDLVAEPRYRLAEILIALRGWLGLGAARIVAVPPVIARVAGALADALAWLGWRSPMRTTAISQLRQGVRGDAVDAGLLPGIRLRNLEEILEANPSSVQERWFAKLYFAKPVGLVALSLFWFTSGLVGLLQTDRAASILTNASLTASMAKAAVLSGSITDMALGGLVAIRRSAPWALKGMMAVSAAYLAGATLWRPDLWSDPLGPLPKVIPGMVLAWAILAMMDER